MGRRNVLEAKILEVLSDGRPKSLREIQKEVGTNNWNAVYYNLISKEDSLINRGCVRVLEDYPEAKKFEGNLERKFIITERGLQGC